jgi:hypothetical protein
MRLTEGITVMATPPTLHPQPAQMSGTVQYHNGYAFLLTPNNQYVLLQFDSPFTGVLDLTRAAQTATVLMKSYPPNSPATFNGILMMHNVNGQNRPVLHLC